MNKSKGLAIATISVSVLILASVLIAPTALRGPKQDSQTGCASLIPGRTVILIDHSEDLTRQTKGEILSRVRRTVEEKVQVGELVSVFYVAQLSKQNLSPAFSYCKPKSQANPLTESEKLVAKVYRERFVQPLDAMVAANIPGSKESPLSQALVDLSLLEQMRSDVPAKLLVFSDLMEHTDRFSLYKCDSSRAAVAAYKTARGANIARPSFNNLSVELHIVPRNTLSKDAGECRDGFWNWFFGDNAGPNASISRLDLPGGV